MIDVSTNDIKAELLAEKLVVIIRGVKSGDMPSLFEALDGAGVRFAEITLNTDGALDSIAAMRRKYEGRIHVGAGTVIDIDLLKQALDAGAKYIVTPNTNPEVVRYCVERGILILPGAMTPSEVATITMLGADTIKLFPANSLGAGYLKELRGPYSGVKLFPVGGITLENMPDFLKAGAAGFGIGGSICNPGLIAEGRFDEITNNARKYVETAKS